VTVTGLRSAEGVVRACMSADAGHFPNCRGDARSYHATVPAQKQVKLKFTGVRPGHYAISLLHDENANGKADRAMGMVPKEGFGFSRDAKVKMGPPSFDDAAIDVGAGIQTFAVKMRYLI